MKGIPCTIADSAIGGPGLGVMYGYQLIMNMSD